MQLPTVFVPKNIESWTCEDQLRRRGRERDIMESTKSGVVKGKALVQKSRTAPRNRVRMSFNLEQQLLGQFEVTRREPELLWSFLFVLWRLVFLLYWCR